MSFLGNPCQCGWCYLEIDENTKICEKCGRKLIKKDYGWQQVLDKNSIIDPILCEHAKIIEACFYCRSSQQSK